VSKLPASFFHRDDVVQIGRELLGKFIFTRLGRGTGRGAITGGMIVETEAYAGPIDRASHAYNNRRTARTEVMYSRGGVAYVYLCYGLHSLFNIITNVEGVPHAVLLRAIEPTEGIPTMLRRRRKKKLDRTVAGGPGACAQALGIDRAHNGIELLGERIWIEDRGVTLKDSQIVASPRVGVAYAGPDASLPWRFRIQGSPWTSRAK